MCGVRDKAFEEAVDRDDTKQIAEWLWRKLSAIALAEQREFQRKNYYTRTKEFFDKNQHLKYLAGKQRWHREKA